MRKTIFITGASSGIGKATAQYFLKKGWNVVATMRSPEKSDLLNSENLLVLKLDVTDKTSITNSVKESIKRFEKIDVVVNNAGYGLFGPIEYLTDEQIKKQFDTNLIGSINVIKEILPHFKENNTGILINVSSMFGRITFPFFTLYAASKHAIEGLSESLRYELADYNIRVKVIEPGTIKTNFNKAEDVTEKNNLDKNPRFKKLLESINSRVEEGEDPIIVAKTIYKAAKDNKNKFRYIPDRTAKLLIFLRTITPLNLFQFLITKVIG